MSWWQKSAGANIVIRGSQDRGKTLLAVHLYRLLVTKYGCNPSNAFGNLTILGKMGQGFTTLKGEDLHQYLWDMVMHGYRNKIIIIDEIDSEFPARFFSSREQTEIALRMWHNRKLRNYIIYTEHLGHGSDLIFYLAANIELIPHNPDWTNNQMWFTCINGFDLVTTQMVANDIYTTAQMYNRWELTEDTNKDIQRERPGKKKTQQVKKLIELDVNTELDIDAELKVLNLS